jgi:dihydroorotate dehydrogenase
MPEYDLSVDFMGIILKNPIVADSAGYALSPAGFRRLIKAGYGAVVTKSATWDAMPSWPRKWERSPRPRCYWDEGMDGTEALVNPGFRRIAQYIREVRELAERLGTHLIGSFSPRTPEEAGEMAREYERAGASAIHMDLVCPSASAFRGRQHPGKGYERLGQWWSETPERAVEAMKAAKDAVDIPVAPKSFFVKWAKENPEIIQMIENKSKIDAYAIHTSRYPGCVWVDIYRGRPYTYPKNPPLEAVVPLTVGNTMSLAKVTKKPILSAGGISTANDVIQMIMVGTTAVGICRAIYRDYKVIERIVEGLEAYMASQALEKLDEIRGVALQYPVRAPSGLALEHEAQAVPLEEQEVFSIIS